MLSLRSLTATCLCLMAGLAAHGATEEPFSTGDMSWTVDPYGVLKTKNWPLVSALTLGIEVAKSSGKKTGVATPQEALPELRYGSDRSVTLLGMDNEKKNLTQTIQRSVRFDQERHAVRVLDVITSTSDEPLELLLRYQTRWQPTVVPKLIKPRFVSSPTDTKSPIGTLIATQDSELPVMFLLFGSDAKSWKRKFTDQQDLLGWTYTGILQPKQRVVLLHWLTFADDVKAATVDKMIGTLTVGGLPADDSLSEDVVKELANYPIPVLVKAPASSKPGAADGAMPLALVKAFADAIHVERSAETDHLVLTAGTVVKGSFDATKVKLENKGQVRELPLVQIAAIHGGHSQSRVFLRDGTVVTGRLSWESATFRSETLGKLELKPESLNDLVLRTSVADGRIDFKPVAWISDGPEEQVMAWKTFPPNPLQATWAGGGLTLSWEDIASIRRLPPPALEHQLTLRDGSRLLAWIDLTESGFPLQDCTALASTPEALLALLADNDAVADIKAASLMLTDGSALAGSLAEPVLRWITKEGEIQLKAADIQQIKRSPPDDALLYEIKTATDSAVSGRPVEPALAWKLGGQTLSVPWRLITELKSVPKP